MVSIIIIQQFVNWQKSRKIFEFMEFKRFECKYFISYRPMKVIYDISVLGVGHYCPRARTGIFRVVESIAYHLQAIEECDLLFCSSEVPIESLDYLEANARFEKVPFTYSEFKRVLYLDLRNINIKLGNTSSGVNRFSLKALRRILLYVTRIAEACFHSVNSKSLAEADIFHSPFYPLPRQVKRERNLRKFLTVYDLIPILYPKFFEFDENHLIQKALESLDPDSWILCISHATKNDLCNYLTSISPSRVFVTHLAASELFYLCTSSEEVTDVRNKYKIPNSPYILSLSTLEPRKNIDHTIRCFAKLVQQEKIKDLYLVLVGTKGWDYNKIFEEISYHDSVKDRIIITGYVADEDLAALYSGALMFVYPSFYEGFGLPPLEAMQCGVPVITSNTSSLPEVVGDAGIMVSPTDADALCQSMLDIYNNSSLRAEMSMRSLEQAKQFSWEKCTQETVAAYKTALSS
jgi:glycosyltransferase involved in cell wall biosynthesis